MVALFVGVLTFVTPQAEAKPVLVHVTVALCDNASQGIVPVPAAIGDGDDPRTNLYWGAMYGLKTWLKRDGWKVAGAPVPRDAVLERIVARKTIAGREVVLTADAWRGRRIREAITSFLENASGMGAGAGMDAVAYIGHDGLMEFSVAPRVAPRSAPRPKAIVLACASLQYFGAPLQRAGSSPLLLTTGLMAPEAYTLTAAIEAWRKGGDVREAAAQAYHRHQKCGLRAARRLFR
jgi:hypothetical protein